MKGGVPPTARKARTGEFTPPGMTAAARSCQATESGPGPTTSVDRVVIGTPR
jgi:hypothetical protein